MSRALALTLPALLLSACVATTTTSRQWGDPYGQPYAQAWARYGQVSSVRETIQHQQGDPAGGAVAGAIIGGLLGNAWSGGHGGATVAGAVGGAMVGAAASQGQGEQRLYEVFVRFDDGAIERFVYQGYLPFNVGERVALTAQGLSRYE